MLLAPAPSCWFDDDSHSLPRQQPLNNCDTEPEENQTKCRDDSAIGTEDMTRDTPRGSAGSPYRLFEPSLQSSFESVEQPYLTHQQQQQPYSSGSSSATTTTTSTTRSPLSSRIVRVARPSPAPSWQELSCQVLPAAARELLTNSVYRLTYHARQSYAHVQWHRQYSELGNHRSGYDPQAATALLRLLEPTVNDGGEHQPFVQRPTELEPAGGGGRRLVNSYLPPFSSLSWVERQLVLEWRTFQPDEDHAKDHEGEDDGDDDDDWHENNRPLVHSVPVSSHLSAPNDDEESSDEFERARTLVPVPAERPVWQHADVCYACHKPFGPTRLRHHCRLCGQSVCHAHASDSHKLPHLGYDPTVPERVCHDCKTLLLEQNLLERVAWRLARCRDFSNGELRPYFEIGVDTVEQAAWRLTQAAVTMARSIPLGAQATVAVETVDVLRKYGLNGMYTIVLRQEFLAAADLLRKALGINRTAWPLSVHELSAAIFYALAQHRAMRGMHPEREHIIHRLVEVREPLGMERGEGVDESDGDDPNGTSLASEPLSHSVMYGSDIVTVDGDSFSFTGTDDSNPALSSSPPTSPRARNYPVSPPVSPEKLQQPATPDTFQPVCEPLSDANLASLIFYAPMALNFIYQEKEVDMQLLAAQQGWRLIYAYLEQEASTSAHRRHNERPASALFVHDEQKIVCVAIRGTATIHDVITDIRHTPVPFPDAPDLEKSTAQTAMDADAATTTTFMDEGDGWTTVFRGQGLAVCGMAGAAVNLYREHIDSILWFARRGYRVRLTGHSLGGGVATLLGLLIYRDLERLVTTSDQPAEAGTRQKRVEENQSADETRELADIPLKVYAYGTPSCVDGRLAECVSPFVTTVVLHDDVVPRLTPASCRGLLKHLLHIRETWVKEHLTDDIMAITERAKTAWAPRWRGSFTLSKSSSSIKRYCRKQYQYGKRKLLSVTEKLAGDLNGSPKEASERGQSESPGKKGERNDNLKLSVIVEDVAGENDGIDESEPRLLLDYMGGMDNRTEGVVIDGEEFFEPAESLIEDDESPTFDTSPRSNAQAKPSSNVATPEGTDGFSSHDESTTPGAVVLEEAPLPRMFIPGKVVHIYAHRGVYRASFVPRNFRELRRISLAGNCLADHKTKSYYEALLEVRTVRSAAEDPPRWTAFDEDDTW